MRIQTLENRYKIALEDALDAHSGLTLPAIAERILEAEPDLNLSALAAVARRQHPEIFKQVVEAAAPEDPRGSTGGQS